MPAPEATAVLAQIGQRVAALRRERGLTQEQLSVRLNVSVGYVGRVERGDENLTVGTIAKLADALGASAWDLLQPPAPNG